MTAGYFTRTYAIWRSVRHQDPETGDIIEEPAQVADAEGRAYKRAINYSLASAREIGNADWIFATAPDTDIEIGDEVRFNGRVLNVRATTETSSGQRIEALCQEVQE